MNFPNAKQTRANAGILHYVQDDDVANVFGMMAHKRDFGQAKLDKLGGRCDAMGALESNN